MARKFADAKRRLRRFARLGAERQRQQIATERTAESHGRSAGELLRQVQHRRDAHPPAHQDRRLIRMRKREAVSQRPQDPGPIAGAKSAEPFGPHADDTVDDLQLDAAVRAVASPRQGERPAEHRPRRPQVGIVHLDRPARFPFDLIGGRGCVIQIEIAAGELDELPRLGRREAGQWGQLQRQPKMLTAKRCVLRHSRDELISKAHPACRRARFSDHVFPSCRCSTKKNFRRGGSYPPPEVRHGFDKPLVRIG